MRQDTQQRRRPRGGSRRPRRGGYDAAPKAPEKLTFWQKIAAFFSGPKKETNGSRSDTPSRAQQYNERNERNDRSERSDRSSRGSDRNDRYEQRPERSERSDRQSRKPEIVEVNSPKLYVGNLSFDASESDLFDLFNGVGKVQNAEIVSNKYTQKSKGFAFVTLQTVDEARRAVTELHDKDFMGRKLVVSGAKTSDTSRENRDSGRDDRESRDSSSASESSADSNGGSDESASHQ